MLELAIHRGSLRILLVLLAILAAEVHCSDDSRGNVTVTFWPTYYHNPSGETMHTGDYCKRNSCNLYFWLRLAVFNTSSEGGDPFEVTLNDHYFYEFQEGKRPYMATNEVSFRPVQPPSNEGASVFRNTIKTEWRDINLKIYVMHVSSTDNHKEFVDEYHNLKFEIDPPMYGNLTLFSRNKKIPSRFSFNVSLECGSHYHGKLCDKYCKPENSSNGHYSCKRGGEKVCFTGWKEPESNCKWRSRCASKPCLKPKTWCVDAPGPEDKFTCRCPLIPNGSLCESDITEHSTAATPTDVDSTTAPTSRYSIVDDPTSALSVIKDFTEGSRDKKFNVARGSDVKSLQPVMFTVTIGATVAIASCFLWL